MVEKVEKVGTLLTLTLEGSLDAVTAPSVEEAYKENAEGVTEIVLEMKKVKYIASAFLRVVLTMAKALGKEGKVIARNASDTVKEVFVMTGFDNFVTIE